MVSINWAAVRERSKQAALAIWGGLKWLAGIGKKGLSAAGTAIDKAGDIIGGKDMSMGQTIWGAALMTLALAGQGIWYKFQPPEIVRAKVTGKVQADAGSNYPGLKYLIHTDEGVFNDFANRSGRHLKENCIYDFNLNGARFHAWPPSYSRNSVSEPQQVSCPNP